ncbi:MAG: phosphoesterase [Desulfobacteraceae bacterium]|nr:phosphoesterase [Desulfobacteraceae bacterium]
MRIYALADIHGKKENIEKLYLVSKKYKPDVIIIAGDISNYFSWKSTLAQLDLVSAQTKTPILCIRGNSDFKRMEKSKIKNLKFLNPAPHFFKGIPFQGVNGTILLPFTSRLGIKENQLLESLMTKTTKETILVVHPPPRTICDRVGNRFCAGSRNLLDFIKIKQPRMVICGHIHEQAGTAFVNNTLVLNCAINKNHHGAIVDLKKDSPPQVNFLQP